MIRNLKGLLLTSLAVVVVGAVSASTASAAHSAAEKFTNVTSASATVVTTEADGSGTTAHYVMDIPGNGSSTCNEVQLVGTMPSGAEPTSLFMEEEGSGYTGCKFLGQNSTVKMEGCKVTFGSSTGVFCPEGKEITSSAGGCTVKIPGGQTFKEAVKYENLGAGGNDMYVTVELATKAEVKGSATGAGCLTPGSFTTAQYTTGNTLLKGWTDPKSTQKPITVDF